LILREWLDVLSAAGTPYGASCVTGSGAELRMPSALELEMCRFQGEHVARISAQLEAGAIAK
jgi:NAD(P)H dehydrogenase (quinone)